MSRETWNLIKNSKRFYVNTYRQAGTVLFVSVALNVLLGIAIHYTYFNKPERNYYSTNGVTPPIQLTSLDEPNYTSVPLLPSDTDVTVENKVIPQ